MQYNFDNKRAPRPTPTLGPLTCFMPTGNTSAEQCGAQRKKSRWWTQSCAADPIPLIYLHHISKEVAGHRLDKFEGNRRPATN